MSESGLTVGLATKLKVAFIRSGWTERLIDEACQGDFLNQCRRALLGHVAIAGKLRAEYPPNPHMKLDVGLAWKLEGALARNGWDVSIVDKACEGDNLCKFRQLLLGDSRIADIKHIIDCDTLSPPDKNRREPLTEAHTKGGQWKWDPKKIKLLEIENVKTNSNWPKGHAVRLQLKGKNVLNACVLDYLLVHPWLIPDDWKRAEYTRIFFWGTIYRWYGRSHGTKHLEVLCLSGDLKRPIDSNRNYYGWTDGSRNLNDYWRNLEYSKDVAAVLV